MFYLSTPPPPPRGEERDGGLGGDWSSILLYAPGEGSYSPKLNFDHDFFSETFFFNYTDLFGFLPPPPNQKRKYKGSIQNPAAIGTEDSARDEPVLHAIQIRLGQILGPSNAARQRFVAEAF